MQRDTPDRQPLLEAVIDNAPFGAHMYALEADGRLVFIGYNRKAQEMLGIDHESLIGMTLEEAFPGIAAAEPGDAYHRIARDGGVWDAEQYAYDDGGIAGVFEVHAFSFGPNRVSVFFRDVTEKRKLEMALEEAESRLARATVDAPFPVMIHAEDGEVMEINKAWTEITGYSLAEIPTISDWTDKAYGADSETVQEDIKPLYDLARGEEQGEYAIRTASGESRVWDFSSAPLGTTPDGRRLVISIASDVTSRDQAREALRQSEERFRSLFDQAPMGYQSLDEDGRFIEVNSAWLETLGYDREEVMGRWFGDFLAPEFVDAFRERFPLFKARGVIHSEFQMVHKNGDRRTIAFEGRVGHHLDGTFKQTHCILADVTERVRAEEQIRESEDRFRYIFSQSVVAKSITRPDGVLDVNDAFCEMLGYAREELANTATWEQLTYPDDIASSQREVDGLLSGGRESARFEKRYVCKDGSIVWADVSTSLRRDEYGQPLYFLSTILDITDKKRDALELERREALLLELLAERDRNLALLATSLNSIVEVMSRVVETRDPYTAGHQRRVSELSVSIAQEMGMPERDVEEIRIAALIHDVGKMSVPAEILSKPGKLSTVEFALIKGHSEAGYQIIASANMEGQTAEIVYQHHERCDGTGYPRGLSGDELLDGAKVIMVADVVEAMSSHRPYRQALGMKPALEEIECGTGVQYDVSVARACKAVFDAGFVFSEA